MLGIWGSFGIFGLFVTKVKKTGFAKTLFPGGGTKVFTPSKYFLSRAVACTTLTTALLLGVRFEIIVQTTLFWCLFWGVRLEMYCANRAVSVPVLGALEMNNSAI